MIVQDPPSTPNQKVYLFDYNQTTTPWRNGLGLERQVQQYQTGGGYLILQRVTTTWTTDPSGPTNPRPSQMTTILDDGVTQSQVQILQVDAYGNPLQVKEFNYANLTPPPPTQRVTNTSYLHSANTDYIAKWIVNRPYQINVGDGTTTLASTAFSYDTYPPLLFTDTPGILNHDPFYDLGYTLRGNVYQKTVGLAPDPTATTTFYYDTAGNVVQTLDPASHQRQATLDATTNYTFPTQLTAVVSQTVNETVTMQYANNTALSWVQDPNTQQTNFGYDTYTRPTTVSRPDGGSTTYQYTDTAPVNVQETTKIDSTQNLVKITYYDGFGRPIQQGVQRDASTWEWVQYVYDNCSCSAIGKQSKVSNPFLSGGTPVFTTTQYDALGRVTMVIPPDGSSTNNNITYMYTANSTKITDQAGQWKQYTYDAFGRTVEVDEPDGAVTRKTLYSYNVLGQLLSITMNANASDGTAAQTRSFTYATSRGWLKSETHPESGQTQYTYTTEGLLDTKTDAKGTVTHYRYDDLHRLTGIRYNTNTYDDVVYAYDRPNELGRLWYVSKQALDAQQNVYTTDSHTYNYDVMAG